MLPIDPEREVVGRTIAAMLMAKEIKRGGRIHVETILTEIGALAGFAAQMSIRKAMIEPQQLDPNEILAEVVTRNGEKYYFSDSLNWILFENLAQPPYSIWAYVRDVVPQASRALLPDMADIVSHAARTIGTARFGVPRLPPENMPHNAPRAALVEHWTLVQQELASWSRRLALRSRLRRPVADAHQPRPACAAAGGQDHHGGRDPDVEGRSAHRGGGVRGDRSS
jgi:hypothetical protein